MAGWGAVIGGLLWLVKGGVILLTGVQPPFLFEAAPFFLGLGLWGLYLRLDTGERGKLAGAGAILALAAVLSGSAQLGAEWFAQELVPQEESVTILTPIVLLAGLGPLAGAALLGIAVWRSRAIRPPWLPLAIPLTFLTAMILIILVQGLVGETTAGDRFLEVPVVILALAWMWLGAMILRQPAPFPEQIGTADP